MAPESADLYAEVAMLRDRVEELNKSVSVLTRYSPLLSDVLNAIDADPLLAAVFLAVDGVRTQAEIVDYLKSRNVSQSSQPSVSRRLDRLCEDFDLVRVSTRTQRGKTYVHTDVARALKLDRTLKSGSAVPKPKKKP